MRRGFTLINNSKHVYAYVKLIIFFGEPTILVPASVMCCLNGPKTNLNEISINSSLRCLTLIQGVNSMENTDVAAEKG